MLVPLLHVCHALGHFEAVDKSLRILEGFFPFLHQIRLKINAHKKLPVIAYKHDTPKRVATLNDK